MKSSAASHCLVIATASLLAAMLPHAGCAQEALANQASAASTPAPEKRYVSDKLVLNVYAEPDQGSARVATIQAGDAIEELGRDGNLVHVRLENGREGWVGASYLVSDAPAIVRLRELERHQPTTAPRVDKAQVEEIARLKKENTALRGQVSELQSRIAAPAPSESEEVVENTEADVASEAPALASAAPGGGVWGWLVAIVLVGTASFASGYQTLARRLRKKFGGLKLY